ncbi:hypothetical protein SVIOM342S_08525 [Streptomyces violaceorubidus]
MLRVGERLEALGGLPALLHRLGLLGDVVVDGGLLRAREPVHQLVLVEVVLRRVRERRRRGLRDRARAVLGGGEGTQLLARVVELWVRWATSSRRVSTFLRCLVVFSLAALLFSVADPGLAVEVVDLLVDLFEGRPVVRRRGARRLGQQGDGGERGGEGRGPYARDAGAGGTRLAVRRQEATRSSAPPTGLAVGFGRWFGKGCPTAARPLVSSRAVRPIHPKVSVGPRLRCRAGRPDSAEAARPGEVRRRGSSGLPRTVANSCGRCEGWWVICPIHFRDLPFGCRRAGPGRHSSCSGRSRGVPVADRWAFSGVAPGCRWGALDSESDEQPL